MITAPSPSPEHEHETEAFSLPLFAFTVIVTLLGLFSILWYFAPNLWVEQIVSPLWKGVVAFVLLSLVNAYMEFFMHRYLMHMPVIPFMNRLYKQHTLHHALTRITRKQSRDGRGVLFVENKFPIVEPEQGEAAFFPWYSLAVFAAVQTPLYMLLHWAFPSFPWFFSGIMALTSSLCIYEILHAINHWSFEKWEPLILHPRWGKIWQPIYSFHLRHHAVIDCNESVSGFFGLPVSDWTFGTCIMPKTVYLDGEEWSAEKFESPRPRKFIQFLDSWAKRTIKRRRDLAAGGIKA